MAANIPKCATCDKPIKERAMIADGKIYHANHFQCSNCRKVLVAEYIIKDEKIFCSECYGTLYARKNCNKCGKSIDGKMYEISDQRFHTECFTCATCNQPFDKGVFYPVKNKYYCLEHHWTARNDA